MHNMDKFFVRECHADSLYKSTRVSGKIAEKIFQQLKKIKTPELSRKWSI